MNIARVGERLGMRLPHTVDDRGLARACLEHRKRQRPRSGELAERQSGGKRAALGHEVQSQAADGAVAT